MIWISDKEKTMKPVKLFIITSLILMLALSAIAQRRVGGKVIEVIDGKTAVVKMSNGSTLTVVLQYVEVPETGQQLEQTVKEHFRKLVFNQTVEIDPRGIKNGQTVAQMMVSGVDVSQQMIRDGAAWYAVTEKNGQPVNQSALYQSQEALAKNEKRGVWADDKMIPAWEFRAARIEAKKQAEKDALEKIKRDAIEARALAEIAESPRAKSARLQKEANSDQIIWANPSIDFSDMPNEKGLIKSKFPGMENDVMMTGSSFYTLSDGKEKRQIECRVMYFGTINSQEAMLIGFISRSEKPVFQTSNALTVTIDGKKMILGKPIRTTKQIGKNLEEMLMYKIDPEKLTTIAQADKVSIDLGNYHAEMPARSHELVKNLTLAIVKK
jgi:micrococcal nuclease